MYRKDIDRHMDNMGELRRMEISAEDRERMRGKHSLLIRAVTIVLILFAVMLIIRHFLIN